MFFEFFFVPISSPGHPMLEGVGIVALALVGRDARPRAMESVLSQGDVSSLRADVPVRSRR